MAERRMFSKTVIDSDSFLDLPLSTQALYFHLSMRADDDGFLNNCKRIMRLVGANQNDYDLLLAKQYIIQFEDGICVIRHWRTHNYIQSDRYHETCFKAEKAMLYVEDSKAYTLEETDKKLVKNKVVNTMYTPCIQNVSSGKDRLGKDRLGKDSIDNNNTVSISLSLFEELGFGTINNVIANDLIDMEKEYTSEWLKAAMEEAVKQGVRNLKYVRGILKTWKAKGFKAEKEKKESPYKKKEPGSGFNNFGGRSSSERYKYLQVQVLSGQATEEEKEEYKNLRINGEGI